MYIARLKYSNHEINPYHSQLVAKFIDPNCNPSAISVIGAMAFNGGVTHAFSSAVVLCELAGNLDHLMKGVAATFISIMISKLFTVSLYEAMQINKNLPRVPDVEYPITEMAAETVMDDLVDERCCPMRVTMAELLLLLRECSPEVSVVPVVRTRDEMLYMGAVRRATLENVYKAYLKQRGDLRYRYLKGDERVGFDVPFESYPCVTAKTALYYVHAELVVGRVDAVFVTERGRLIGRITKKEIASAAAKGKTYL